MKRFADKRVLVTGASRGLGRAIAVAFGAEGATVFVGYRSRAAAAEETAAEIKGAGGSAEAVAIDVGDEASVEAAFERMALVGGIDVAVNNAAIASDEALLFASKPAWDDVLRTNLGGTFLVARAAAKQMVPKRTGAIVLVASVAGVHASPGQSNYAASKGGVIAFTKTIAAELAPRGVRVNAVVPGLLSTGMVARLDHRVLAKKKASIPLGRLGEGEEVARTVLFLASEDASYVVGQALVVDGGLTL